MVISIEYRFSEQRVTMQTKHSLSLGRSPHILNMLVLVVGAFLGTTVGSTGMLRLMFLPSQAHAQDHRKNTSDRRSSPPMVNSTLPDVATVFEQQKDTVVAVKTEMAQTSNSYFSFSKVPRQGQGSGFVVDKTGYIITNYHVIAGAKKIEVSLSTSRKRYRAQLIGTDEKTDLALIKITPKEPLSVAKLANSKATRVGEWVVAIGSPFGLEHSVTAGILSAKGRKLGQGLYDDFLQTDASINPGNSGGPLFNLWGEVIGVNTAIIRDGQGIGFAVPIHIVKMILPQLKSRGYVMRGYIGAGIQTLLPEHARVLAVKPGHGVLIAHVAKSGPAHHAGVRVNDVITHFNKTRVRTEQELLFAVAETKPGHTVPVRIVRKGKAMSVHLTVKERPDTQRPKQHARKSHKSHIQSDKGLILGVEVSHVNAALAKSLNLKKASGVHVDSVRPNSLAAQGLKKGDVIMQVGKKLIHNADDLAHALRIHPRDEPLRLLIWRAGRAIFLALRAKP